MAIKDLGTVTYRTFLGGFVFFIICILAFFISYTGYYVLYYMVSYPKFLAIVLSTVIGGLLVIVMWYKLGTLFHKEILRVKI